MYMIRPPDQGVEQATMATGRLAARRDDCIKVVLDLLRVTGQVLLDLLACDWSSAKTIVGRHVCKTKRHVFWPTRRRHLPPSRPVTPPRGTGASRCVEATQT